MLNITNTQGDGSQNHSEIASQVEWLLSKRQKRMWKKGFLTHWLTGIQISTAMIEKQYGSSKKNKTKQNWK